MSSSQQTSPAIQPSYKLASRETKPENTIIKIRDNIHIGGTEIIIIAGPCAIENEEQARACMKAAHQHGAKILRGGAFKPRTNPYDFEGLGIDGLKILKKISDELDTPTITEILDIRDIEVINQYTDIFQIGARNMQNFTLLKELGKTKKPITLKRGLSATITELLLAAEHILMNGNPNVILCERGIRTFETDTRSTLALATVPLCKELSHLPIIVDPSHATGKQSLTAPLALAAIACGADGILIDVHTDPEAALCDGDQALLPEQFERFMKQARNIAKSIDRSIE